MASRTRSQIWEIKRPEILKKIAKYKQTMSFEEISQALFKENKIHATASAISKTYNTLMTAHSAKMMKGSEEAKDELKEVVIDYKSTLEKCHDKLWEIINSMGADNKDKISAIKAVTDLLDRQDKYLHRLENALAGMKIDKLELTQNVVNKLDDLEAAGLITINRNAKDMSKLADAFVVEEKEDGRRES